jgi:uncharacterized protein (DUF302 family)
MEYSFYKTLDLSFDAALDRVAEALKEEGFGVLTEIDVKATLKKKLDVDFRNYRILGACNPPFAHRSLLAEPRLGLMLPCNVIVQETDDGKVEVAAIDPAAAMASIENEALAQVAEEVRGKLQKVVESL